MDLDTELAQLVARCQAGDGAAWTALVRRFQRLVYAIVCRMGLDEHTAADVFQVVFERLQKHLPRIQEPGRLQAWIVTTAKREALLQRQRARRLVSMTGDDIDAGGGAGQAPEWDLADDAPSPDQELSQLQQLDRLRVALDHLEPRCRQMIEMLFADEDERMPYDEIARRLGMPVGSLGPTRQRCLERLRKLMA